MKNLTFNTGGRPLYDDDLQTLQQEAQVAAVGPWLGLGGFILTGCEVSQMGGSYNVAAGLVCLDGQFLRFAGASGVALPMQLQAGTALLTDVRTYEDGTSRACLSEVPAVLVAVDATYASERVVVDTWGGKRRAHVLKALGREVGDVGTLASSAYVPAHYDATGLGKPGTPAWGWALSNGQNGTDDLMGFVSVGYNPTSGVFTTSAGAQQRTANAPGQLGGAEKHQLTEGEIPPLAIRLFGSNDTAGEGGFPDLGDDTSQVAATSAGRYNDNAAKTLNTQSLEHNNMQPYRVMVKRQWIGY